MFYRMLLLSIAVLTIATACPAQDRKPADGNIAAPSELLKAAEAGDCAGVAKLAATATDVDARNDNGSTVLLVAALNGCTEACAALLDRGADPDAANAGGERPVDAAAVRGHVAILKILHDRGADMLFVTSEGATVVYYATMSGDTETARLAVELARVDIEKSGADPDEQKKRMSAYINIPGPQGATPLMNAAWSGNVETVKMLIDLGADLYAENYRGMTALVMAIRWERKEVEDLLREAGPLFLK